MKSPRESQGMARPRTWIEYLAKILTMGTIFMSVVGIIGYSYDLYRHGSEKHYIGWFSSAGFVLLTVPISIRLIVKHLTHYNAPHIQRYVVRIIWMVPIYSVESWLALRFKSASIYIETIRECYEAYVIFCFFYFLIAVLGDEQPLIMKLKQKPLDYGRHSWPISLFVSPWTMGSEILQKCKFGVFQYVIIKNFMAIVVCILASRGEYHEGKFHFNGFYLYQTLICNASQLWALYCLVLFYFATKEELAPWRPVGKFLSVKTVVFFTWWQAIIIDILTVPLRKATREEELEQSWTNNEISKGLQNYLICIEMFFASIAFTYAFTHKDYQIHTKVKNDEDRQQGGVAEGVQEAKPFLSALMQSSVPDEIFTDIKRYVRTNSIVKRVLGTIGIESDPHHTDSDSEDDEEEGSIHSFSTHSTTELIQQHQHGSSSSAHTGSTTALLHHTAASHQQPHPIPAASPQSLSHKAVTTTAPIVVAVTTTAASSTVSGNSGVKPTITAHTTATVPKKGSDATP